MADEQTPGQIILPERLVSSVDLSRLVRELGGFDEMLREETLRRPDVAIKVGRCSATLEDLARLNSVDLTDQTQRVQLLELLQTFQLHAPRIHMSLATEPSAKFNHKIIIWLRANIHPLLLLESGLQPNLAAGCMIRTNNKMFDMSLRHRFVENRGLLLQKITEIGAKAEPAAPAETGSTT